MDDALLADAARRLARDYGLDPAAIGRTVLGAALAELRADRVAAFDAPAAIEDLFNALPVGLSWFDRDVAQLQSAATWAAAQRRPLRILSAPCARGEEVWSLAGALLDAGVSPMAVQILGVDAMPAAIERAELGEYPVNAAAGRRDAPLPWWLAERGGRLQVHPRLRPLARFRVANLLEPAVLADCAPFDLILSRNFLIYLTPAARARWCVRLAGLLHPDGRLYSAASEPLPAWTPAFVACPGDVPGACIPARAAPMMALTGERERPTGAVRTVAVVQRPSSIPVTLREPLTDAPHSVDVPTTTATRPDPRVLADAGELQAAEALLTERLAREMPAAEDLVTAALIALSRGRIREAEDALRRALFLDHRHAEASGLLAALLDQRGEAGEAARLRTRVGGRR